MNQDEDVTAALWSAFDREPPLGISTADLIRRGRSRVRRRRAAAAAAGGTAVVALVFGAAALAGPGGPVLEVGPAGPGDVPCAGASSSAPPSGPAGLTTGRPSGAGVPTTGRPSGTGAPTTGPPSGSSGRSTPTGEPRPCVPPLTPERAAELTTVLAGNWQVPAGLTARTSPSRSGDPLAFEIEGDDQYDVSADLVNGAGESGQFFVKVAPPGANSGEVDCAYAASCEERTAGGRTVQLALIDTGERRARIARTELADGSEVYAMASATSLRAYAEHDGGDGLPTLTAVQPLLSFEELVKVVTLPELRF
ncbi:hypothetical protein [Umezawaea beigongshangensis]|uniref:hypothetical protein n=1 Tax=Umezawaea beigongshangensis TaxID=2780383 RepID=UPI0018F1E7F6|nr:hypothetical protein [Umezawaea beigongshangensis]